MKNMLYAAYGSNLHPNRLSERVPSARLCGSSVLAGWGLRFHKRGQDGSSKCDIIPSSEIVHVAIYKIDPSEKPNLDKFESLGNGYSEKEMYIPDYGDCFLYVAQESHIDPDLRPFGWYKGLVLVGCLHHGFPTEYVGRIKRVSHVDDLNRQRHERWMRLVNNIQRKAMPCLSIKK